MQVHHPSWSFSARLGFPVGSGATPCPPLRDASGDNGVFMTPKAVRWLVCGLLVSLGASGSDECPGEAAGSCWLLVAHPDPLFLSQLGDISAYGKEVAMHSSSRILSTKLFLLSFSSSRKRFAGVQRAETTFFMTLQALKKMQLANAIIYQLVFCPEVPASQKSFVQPSSRALIWCSTLGQTPG